MNDATAIKGKPARTALLFDMQMKTGSQAYNGQNRDGDEADRIGNAK